MPSTLSLSRRLTVGIHERSLHHMGAVRRVQECRRASSVTWEDMAGDN